MYGYIYLTENLVNGKCYIGQHKHNEFDERYKGSGNALRYAFKKYGKENFITSIIEECDTFENLNEKEKYWIEKCDAVKNPYFYNIEIGGASKECKRKVKIHLSTEHKNKIRLALLGKKKSHKARENMSIARRKRVISEVQKQRASESMKGKNTWKKGCKLTKEHKMKISNFMKTCHWYNDGKNETLSPVCPNGFVKGRLKSKRDDLGRYKKKGGAE